MVTLDFNSKSSRIPIASQKSTSASIITSLNFRRIHKIKNLTPGRNRLFEHFIVKKKL